MTMSQPVKTEHQKETGSGGFLHRFFDRVGHETSGSEADWD
jgi:hypothetical protein